MIAIFTRIEDESGTVLDFKNEESTCNSLNKDLKILMRLLNNDINNRKNSVNNKFIKNDISTLVQAILLLKITEQVCDYCFRFKSCLSHYCSKCHSHFRGLKHRFKSHADRPMCNIQICTCATPAQCKVLSVPKLLPPRAHARAGNCSSKCYALKISPNNFATKSHFKLEKLKTGVSQK